LSPNSNDDQNVSETEVSASGAAQAIATFRLPHYGMLWSSNLIQFICFHVLFLAMQWLVTSLTDLRIAVGFLAFVQGGTIALASPFAGVIVDRHPKRNLMIFGRLGVAVVAISMGLLAYGGVIEYWHLLVMAIVGGTLAALLGPAAQTYVVDVVGRNRTDHAISLNAIGGSVGTIGGAALAGLLIKELGVVSTYFAAAVGVVLAALLLLTIPIPGHAERKERTSLRSDLVEGLAYVRARPHLLLALAACAMALFNGAISPMRVIYARHVFGAGADAFGMMSVFHGGGTMLAALFLTLRPPSRNFGVLITGTMLLYAIGVLMYSFAFSFEYILAVEFWLGISGQAWHICALIGFQLAVPEEMRGRVLSMVFTLAQLGFVGGFIVGGLADQLGDQVAVGIFGAIPTILLSCILVFGWKTLRKM
jgi:MFS family permease